MNRFELFTLIYYALDAFYEDEVEKNEKVSILLDDMNPFVWKECISADPAVYKAFCKSLSSEKISLDNSLDMAREYVQSIDLVDVSEAFQGMSDEEWISACRDYLESNHKGADLPK